MTRCLSLPNVNTSWATDEARFVPFSRLNIKTNLLLILTKHSLDCHDLHYSLNYLCLLARMKAD